MTNSAESARARRREYLRYLGSAAFGAGLAIVPEMGAGCVFAASTVAAEANPPKLSGSVVQRIRVTRGAARHRAFPGLLRLADGTLLVLFREGTDHWRTDDSVLKLTRSGDGGKTWTEANTLLKEDGWGFAAHHGPRQLSDGSILTAAMSLRNSGGGQREFRTYAMRSSDGGGTWQVSRIGPMPGWAWQNQYGRAMEIDGRLWLPGGGQRKGENDWRNGYFVSLDNGRTWPEWHTICAGLQDEKDIVELPDRRLLAMIRSGTETYRSYSSDRGETWNQGEKLDLFGQCPSLLLLPSGNLLFAYRQVRPGVPAGIGLAVSGDSGLTWRELEPLYLSPTGSRDCAYPSMILSESGEVLCAYYTTFTEGNCHIELARIEVRESPVG